MRYLDEGMPAYKVVPTDEFRAELSEIGSSMVTYEEDLLYVQRLYKRVEADIAKLSYLAGTSPNRYVIAKDGTKYYRYNVNKNRHAVFYTLDEENHACYLWHIMNAHMNFGGRL